MITFEQISELFCFDTQKRLCVEIQFMLAGSEKFDYCWMGKLWSRERRRDVFWYGLTADGKNAYDYATFEEMAAAPVFDGFSLKTVWDRITIESIDGCDPVERLWDYLDKSRSAPGMGAPRPQEDGYVPQ